MRLASLRRLMTFVVLSLVWGSTCVSGRAAENWPQFRGPGGDGLSDAKKLPVTWSESQNVAWKTPIRGKAWSSPVVWEKQIWVTTAPPDGKQLFALCLDRDNGQIVHDVKVFDIADPQKSPVDKNSYASSTPVIEAGRVYVHFGAHGTACLDTQTAKILWTRQDLPCNHWRLPASSPILFEDLLILTFDGHDLQYLVALDKQTGKNVWKRDRNIAYKSDDGDIKKAYSTPSVFDIGGVRQLVSPSAGASIAYDPRTGDELWRVQSGGMNASCRPLFGNGLLYMNSPDGGINLFAVKPDGRGDVTGSHIAWKVTKGAPRYGSPLLLDHLLFVGSDQGVLTCVDATTGETVWQNRVGGVFTASPIAAAGHVYFFSEDGSATVIAAEREFKVLATNKLDDGFMASPAVTGNAIILRTKSHLYRVEEGGRGT